MRLSLPRRVPMGSALAFSGLIAVAQIIEGTTPIIAVMSFVFILATALAFNVAGGAVYPSGAFIASCSVLTAMLGMVAKVLLGEPFQRNLLVPEKTIEVYTVGMLSMLAASYVNRLVRPKRALLDRFKIEGNASGIGIVCLAIGIVGPLVIPKEIVSTFNQGNAFFGLAILIPVFDTVRRTDGRRSFNRVSFLALLYMTVLGILSFSKEGMFGPSAAWAVAAVGGGYRTSISKLAVLITTGAFALAILTPYSQTARAFGKNLDVTLSAPLAIQLLSHPFDLRDTYLTESSEQLDQENNYHLFDRPQGLLDRLNMLAPDDALIRVTDRGQVADPSNLWSYFMNLIPRYVWPDKPILHWGNVYAHKIDIIGVDDETTGISFSPFADGYHTAQWMGITFYSFAIFLFGFFMMDAVAGSADRSFWALMYVLFALHWAPEGMLESPVYGGGTYAVIVIVVAYVCTRVFPIVTNLAKRSDKNTPASFVQGEQNVQSA